MEIIKKYPTPFMNCFTGSQIQLIEKFGFQLQEHEIFSSGNGFLFRAGKDEQGYPEYVFSAHEVGRLGAKNLGFQFETQQIINQTSQDAFAKELQQVCERLRGVIVWVNTRYLKYSDIYTNSGAYLHAILVHEVSASAQEARISDIFVAEKENNAYEVWISIEDLFLATTDRIKSGSFDWMGNFIWTEGRSVESAGLGSSALLEQARLYAETPMYRNAISLYAESCAYNFHGDQVLMQQSARRLFHHARVLVAVPALQLFEQTLSMYRLTASQEICSQMRIEWGGLALMALKLEVSGSDRMIERIGQQFVKLDQMMTSLWSSVEKEILAEKS